MGRARVIPTNVICKREKCTGYVAHLNGLCSSCYRSWRNTLRKKSSDFSLGDRISHD